MTTLKDFVKDSLIQVAEGIREFNKAHAKDGASTHPIAGNGVKPELWASNNLIFTGFGANNEVQYASLVDFDVAVTAEEGDKAKAGGSVAVVSLFKADGTLEAETKNTSVSRIQFRVPIQVNITETQSSSLAKRRRNGE